MPDAVVPDPEDAKLVTLARSARARARTVEGAHAAEGAAVRDVTGRTYVAATVTLPSLPLGALAAAVVLAAASGATGLEAAAVVRAADGGPPLAEEDLAAVRDLGGPGTPVLVAGPDGTVHTTLLA